MMVNPERMADRGCWISDDRVSAFVSSRANGISEIVYHGAQPASRNARVFVGTSGAFRFALSSKAGVRSELALTGFEWTPASMKMRGVCPLGSVELRIVVAGRNVKVLAADFLGEASSFLVRLDRTSLFADVHGQRSWETAPGKKGWVKFLIKDKILLNEWMKREGPYGSDFLIPEPIRRRIFNRRLRSGLATSSDLLPGFQNNPLHIYDAEVRADVGGEGFCVTDAPDALLFEASLRVGADAVSPFLIYFDIPRSVSLTEGPDGKETVPAGPPSGRSPAPTITVPGFKRTEQFFSTVPGLVDSCAVGDYGIPRATPGGYYWIWAWDAMVTALVALRWGATDLAAHTAAFVDQHRDEDCIPMRWTHSLEPLDTQPHGALDTLWASLEYALARELRGPSVSAEIYSRMVEHLHVIARHSDRRGLSSNIGFYPDLPLRFGRTEESAVAMENGAFYTFCRILENCARELGDEKIVATARTLISALEHSFCEAFWDKRRKFFIDALERKSGERNTSYPIFTLLFLHYPLGIRLIRGFGSEAAGFIAKHLLTPFGVRLLPAWDKNAGSETVTGAWYPHWDAYAVKLLRKSGRAAEIMLWLGSVERVLEHLGYAPEYLRLDHGLATDGASWLQHGSASNLNCVTGWYEALLEGLLGLDFDPGGLLIVPLGLPIEKVSVQGVCHLGSRWNLQVRHEGAQLQELRVDGKLLRGCLKVPWNYCDGGEHEIEVLYGDRGPGPRFIDLSNAEVLDIDTTDRGVEVVVHALGQVDLQLSAPDDWMLSVDGSPIRTVKSGSEGPRQISLPMFGRHTLLLSRRA